MMLALLSILPALLWEDGPATAPDLRKAGIEQIAVTRDAAAWSSTGIAARLVDPSTLTRVDPPGVDYQSGTAGATAAPWVQSNLWRMIREPKKSFLYEVAPDVLPLAMAEAYAGGAATYFRVGRDALERFAAPYRFLHGLHGPPLEPRVNFTLLDDRSPEIEEVMNLLVRRNLLFRVATRSEKPAGMQVRLGAPGFPKESATDPYLFAAVVRSRIGDDNRLIRVFGSDTVLARFYGAGGHGRVHLLRYGRNQAQGVRVRVLGRYPRVYLSDYGRNCERLADVTVDNTATEFTIPELGPFAIIDLESAEPGVLHSARATADVPLTADPQSAFWSTAPRVFAGRDTYGRATPLRPMEVRSRWTGGSLYILYICPFETLHLKPDPATDRETPSLWNWDVAEAFIGSQALGPGRYREFELSPQGEWVDLDIRCENGESQHDLEWNSRFESVARIDRLHKMWYGEMRIPMPALGAPAARAGDRFPLGLYRTSGPPPTTVFVSWQPTDRATFHVPESFGALVLDGAPARSRAAARLREDKHR